MPSISHPSAMAAPCLTPRRPLPASSRAVNAATTGVLRDRHARRSPLLPRGYPGRVFAPLLSCVILPSSLSLRRAERRATGRDRFPFLLFPQLHRFSHTDSSLPPHSRSSSLDSPNQSFADGCWVAGEALLELKTAFNATPGALSSWRPVDGDPCGWEGISCSFPDLRVQSINLPYMQLGGIISPSIGKLSKLQMLALHQNSLHGPIPLEIKNCTQLRAMYATLSRWRRKRLGLIHAWFHSFALLQWSSNSLQTNHRLTEDLGYTITLPAGTTLEMD